MAFPYLPAIAGALGDPMTLAKLAQQSAPSQMQQAQPQQAPAPLTDAGAPPPGHVVSPADATQEEPEIVVENEPYPKSKYRNGIVQGGTFRLGGLGGNILGALGDAFLMQAGQNPVYRQRLQQARISEAMESFQQDPERAIDMLMQIDPEAAAKLAQQQVENRRADRGLDQTDTELGIRGRTADSQIRTNDMQWREGINDRAMAMLGKANAQTYPALRRQVINYYKSYGMEPPFELPETFDEAAVTALRLGRVPVGTQMELGNQRDYQQGQLEIGRRTAGARQVSAEAARTRADRPPAQRPRTTGNVMADILAKIARGEQLTPGEDRLYQDYRTRGRRPQPGGGAGGWVKNPNGPGYIRRTS